MKVCGDGLVAHSNDEASSDNGVDEQCGGVLQWSVRSMPHLLLAMDDGCGGSGVRFVLTGTKLESLATSACAHGGSAAWRLPRAGVNTEADGSDHGDEALRLSPLSSSPVGRHESEDNNGHDANASI